MFAAGPGVAIAGSRLGTAAAAVWIVLGALLTLAGPLSLRSGRAAALLTLGVAAAGASLCANSLSRSPASVLVLLSLATLVIAGLWGAPRRRLLLRAALAAPAVQRAAAAASLATWAWVVLGAGHWGSLQVTAVLFAFGLHWLLLAALAIVGGHPSRRRRWIGPALLIAGALAATLIGRPAFALALLAFTTGTAALLQRGPHEGAGEAINWFIEHPARLIVSSFFALCAVGTALLALPASAAGGVPIAAVDAAFTAVSAACVTGLSVVDTPTTFSHLGCAFIVVLVQIGGLGIMTFYTVTLRVFRRRLSLKHELAVAGTLTGDDRGRLFPALKQVLTVTALSEGTGALLLTMRFAAQGEDLGPALWRGVFTAVSAFCNAGFALQSDNLISYGDDPAVLHVVALLIVLGGLSPSVIALLPRVVRRVPLPLQAKLVVSATLLLLALGFAGFLSFEWQRSLAEQSLAERLHHAWFQSVTTRTAGFNSVDMTELGSATQVLMIVLMFVGAAPGGTAGGIKITTAAVLVLAVVAAMRGRKEAEVFGRRIGQASVYKAAAVATVGLMVAVAALVAVLLTQHIPPDMAAFEVVSALGTVGLSTGGTARLDGIGKAIIMACMFMGRVGPLTLFVFLQGQREETVWALPDEEVEVG